MTIKEGDVVYGYAIYHCAWVWCKVREIRNIGVFGSGIDGKNVYYIKFETIIPNDVVNSPLFKLMHENI